MPKAAWPADTLDVMSEGDEQPNQAAQVDATQGSRAGDAEDGLTDIWVSLDQAQALEALSQAARRGKLPEFAIIEGTDNTLFRASALGHPFDRDLLARAKPDGDGIRLSFGLRWRKKAPIIYLAAMVFTVEPGRYFLELMIPGSWGWGSILWWYYPLTIIPIPFAWRAFMKQARRSTMESAQESHASIRKILGGMDPPR